MVDGMLTHRIPGIGLGLALALAAGLSSAMPLRSALELAHHCTSETSWAERIGADDWRPVCGDAMGRELEPERQCWPELDSDGVTRTYCGSDEQHTCGLYAQWAYWACEHGFGEHAGSGSCSEAADEAVEVCGEWQVSL